MDIGELITAYRKDAGMTIDELVASSGVSRGTITKIISGVTKAPTLDNVKAIARALGRPLADFDDDISQIPEFSFSEKEHIKKYRDLDDHGKQIVDGALRIEYDRMAHIGEQEKIEFSKEKISPAPAAPETGENELRIQAFISVLSELGLLREGQKLSPDQITIIKAVLEILQAALTEAELNHKIDNVASP